ncbi:MAG: hypothetical protein A3F14_01045 [Gammaproteobacteria bacterium RIFCSPHIGHO2_12_FULL_43_28]|nr:MAG: hypothetical protein A3F14_01045 [Gammaproteobacteria bacterium RIFCSPHIGHO2_12_FULL_43_28]
MNDLHSIYCRELGIIAWQQRNAEPPISMPSAHMADKLAPLRTKVAACTACELHTQRMQTVFGVGSETAKLMLIGEAPGFHEDQQGEPFVGRAGQLLGSMLKSIGFERNDVYIANVLKCRPPNNRDPLPLEVKTCTAFLDQQIALIQPMLLVALGRIAAHYLLQTKVPLETLRNKIHAYGKMQIPLITTYHPAYLLRNPIDKKKAFFDLQHIKKRLLTQRGDEPHGKLPNTAAEKL